MKLLAFLASLLLVCLGVPASTGPNVNVIIIVSDDRGMAGRM
jgi:hypothetical protein